MQGPYLTVKAVSATVIAQLRTHTTALFERITLAPTVASDLRKGRSAQRFPAFS